MELSIVDRPWVLDFVQAALDAAPDDWGQPAWMREKARLFGADWPDVQHLLNALRQYGIFFRDVDTLNISLRP